MLLVLSSVLLFFVGVGVAVLTSFPLGWWGLLPILVLWRYPRWVFLFLAFLFGLWRVSLYEEARPDLSYGYVELQGKVVEELDRRVDHQKITVLTEQGRVLVKLSLYKELEFGDVVFLKGELEAPSEDIEGFNYANFLARYRVWSVMYDPYVGVVQEAAWSWKGAIFSWKQKMEQRINELYFEPEASFVAGLLLGSRKGMPLELADAFQATGLTHIIAISGYNIGLVVALMFSMFGFLPLRVRVGVTSLAIFFFVILVGASAAVVRAGIMGVLTLFGLFWGEKSQVYFALLWSAVIMVLMNPYTLIYDVGFQLSFASTLGLLVFVPMLECVVPGKKGVLREAFVLTMAAQIATLPLIVFHFGRLSLISPLANVLVAPFLPLAMLFSALSLLGGELVALLAYLPLRAVELIALWLAKIPFVNVSLPMTVAGFVLFNLWLTCLGLRFYKSILVRAFRISFLGVVLLLSDWGIERRAKQ